MRAIQLNETEITSALRASGSHGLAVFVALKVISRVAGTSQQFEARHSEIAFLCGLSERRLRKHLRALEAQQIITLHERDLLNHQPTVVSLCQK